MVQTPAGKVFISYSHKDKAYLDRLQEHLRPHVRSGALPVWVDTQLQAGDEWKKEIEGALEATQVAILLVSVSFLASDFVAEEELPKLLKAAQARGVVIVPVILTPCAFKHSSLYKYQAINDPSRPLSLMPEGEQDTIWNRLVERVLNAQQARPPDLPTQERRILPISRSAEAGPEPVRLRTPPEAAIAPQPASQQASLASPLVRPRPRTVRGTVLSVSFYFWALLWLLGGLIGSLGRSLSPAILGWVAGPVCLVGLVMLIPLLLFRKRLYLETQGRFWLEIGLLPVGFLLLLVFVGGASSTSAQNIAMGIILVSYGLAAAFIAFW